MGYVNRSGYVGASRGWYQLPIGAQAVWMAQRADVRIGEGISSELPVKKFRSSLCKEIISLCKEKSVQQKGGCENTPPWSCRSVLRLCGFRGRGGEATRFTSKPAISSSSPVCSPKMLNPRRQRRDPDLSVFLLSSSVQMQCLKSDAVRGSKVLHPNFPEAVARKKEDVLSSSLFLCLPSALFPLALSHLAGKEGEARLGEEESAKPKHLCRNFALKSSFCFKTDC